MIDTKSIENAICQDCFNYDCPSPCGTENYRLVSCLFIRMKDELIDRYKFDFVNPYLTLEGLRFLYELNREVETC